MNKIDDDLMRDPEEERALAVVTSGAILSLIVLVLALVGCN